MAKTDAGLLDVNNQPITNMNASWTSKPYPMDEYKHLGVHLFWDDPSPRGTITLEYSCDPQASNTDVQSWIAKSVVNVDGTFEDVMFLDANVPIAVYRVIFTRTAGAAGLTAYTTRKR